MNKTLKDSFWLLKKADFSSKLFFQVVFFSLFTLLFEVIGVGIFIPILNYIKTPDNDNLFNSLHFFQALDNNQKTILVVSTVFMIFLIKSFLIIIQSIYLVRFWSMINENLTIKVFKNILDSNYSDFIKKSSSSYISVIISEIEQFSELTKFTIYFIVESFVLVCIFFLLIIYNPVASLLIFILVVITSSILFFVFNKRLIFWGKMRQLNQDNLQNIVNGGIINFLSININNTQSYFTKKLKKSITQRNSFIKRQYVYESIPRSFIEIIALLIIITTFVVLSSYLNYEESEIISFLVFLIIAFSRVLPSINRLLTSYNFINFSNSVVERLIENFKNSTSGIKKLQLDRFKNKIEFKNVSFSYDGLKYPINEFSYEIQKGDIIGVFGKSGSGKSTFVKMLLGFLNPEKGEITIDGDRINEVDSKIISKFFGYVEQNVRIFNASLYENISFDEELTLENKGRISKLLEICQLDDILNGGDNIDLIEDGINLSGGQIQRIGLARALYKKPEILILDEFSSALDPKNRNKISSILLEIKKNNNLTIILVSHDLFFKSFCDKIISF